MWRWRDDLGKKVIVYKTIKARTMWNQIIQRAWESGEPGIIFMERANDLSNSYYYAPLCGTNPCVTGDTKVLTYQDEDPLVPLEVPIRDLVGRPNLQLWVDDREAGGMVGELPARDHLTLGTATKVVRSGIKPVWVLQLEDGSKLRCTADHRIRTIRGMIEAQNLRANDLVHVRGGGTSKLVHHERAPTMEDVFDVIGTRTHTFIANGIVVHNCAEELLPASASCNLSHLNLAKFVSVEDQFPEQERTAGDALKRVDLDGLTVTIQAGIRFLDTIIDLNQYHEDAIEKQQTLERRTGLGLLGYGEMLLRLGLRYGSEEAIKFTDRLMRHFSTQSYLASSELAREYGSFPAFDAEKFLKSGFMKRHTKAVKEAVAEHGIRNVTVNTIAPTGSVAPLLQTSGGCEPFFEMEYTSTTRIGIVTERPPVGNEIVKKFGTDRTKWPDYVVTAQNGITPEQHVRTQGTMQRWIDAGISKTIGLPGSATVADVASAYRLMWELGCKGGTVYRDGSRDEQVLYLAEPKEVEAVKVEVVVEDKGDLGIVLPRPDVGLGVTFSEKSPLGTVHATIRHDAQTGEATDLFILTSAGDVAADAEAIGRLISIILRWPNNRFVNQQTRLELVREQLMDILGRGQVGMGPTAKRSLPDTIAKIIDRYLAADFPLAHLPFGMDQIKALFDALRQVGSDREAFDKVANFVLHGKTNGDDEEQSADQYKESMEQAAVQAEQDGIRLPYDLCPDCGSGTLVTIPGKCPYCRTCGHTRC